MKSWKELRKEVVALCFSYLLSEGVEDPDACAEQDVDALITAVRKDERKRIWDRGVTQMDLDASNPTRMFIVEARLVDPKEI